ncbi:expressed unknown protein [Ectocarpus siliculosus]|uniref:Uncharacterized protein n=1 Tax=Ectocarpus siliculosus TaxID=2880 RepID=D7G8Z4_ECTSI|nr:expressed unknown protein [Ectocarpus siliculosus]|eukprot:CBJ28155.1 expressed unknown protein [Ectocarpus siliculosus]
MGVHPLRQRQAVVALHSAVLGEDFVLYSSGGKPAMGPRNRSAFGHVR